ncbi:MAG: pantoate--beta-alanine ligase [Candidatus Brocadiales bacterium]|nr:pantoate--beta-alanine ligase [Candidatus Bathyanammoxibius sp.]
MAEVIKKTEDMKARAGILKARGRSVGFVPTMGTLHEGHLSLIRRAGAENDAVVLSIFVNPIQFDQRSDFQSYPRQFESDMEMASGEGVDVVFAPDEIEMYPEGFIASIVEVNGSLTRGLCGAMRPGHFRGVTTVVSRLFDIVRPDRAYFGQKDLQQAAVIKKMVEDLGMDIDIVTLPTVRDADGLAVSSRNRHLTGEERRMAASIHRALERAAGLFASGERDVKVFVREMRDIMNSAGISRIDYISIVDPETLEEVAETRAGVVAAVAAWVGGTRLIDNMTLGAGAGQESVLHKAQTV